MTLIEPFRAKPLRIAALVLKMMLGVLFLVSAIAKFLGMDQFEVYVYSFGFFPLSTCFLLARLIVGCEMLLGIGLLANLCSRLVNTATIIALTLFTLFLGYVVLIGRTDSCQCFGQLVNIDPVQSIIKNAILLTLMLPVLKVQSWPWQPRWWMWVLVCAAPFAYIFIRSAPDNWLYPSEEEIYNHEKLDSALMPEGFMGEMRLNEGRKIVAFLTPGCQFCKLADKKISTMCQRDDFDAEAVVYLTPAGDSVFDAMDTVHFSRPSHNISTSDYLGITYGQRPMVFLLDNGKVSATCHYRNIFESDFVKFLNHED